MSSEFDTTVDLVDRGADPTGRESIVPLLEEEAADGRLLYLPDGIYLMDRTFAFGSFERFGIVGDGATIVPDPEFDSLLFFLNGGPETTRLRFEGLTVDYSGPEASGWVLNARVGDGLVVRDVVANGETTVERLSEGVLVRLDVTDPNGEGLVERLRLPDGAPSSTRITGCYVGNANRGDLTFRNCHVEGFPDNGLYADPPAGRMTVDGGYYANSGVSNVRVRGDSVVRGVYVRADVDDPEISNVRGIRLTDYEPQHDVGPALVQDCRIEFRSVPGSDGAITLSSDLAQASIRDTEIVVDADGVKAVNVKTPAPEFDDGDIVPSIRVSNLRIGGDASGGSAIDVSDRDHNYLEGLDVRQPGDDRNGIRFNRSSGNTVTDSRFSVTGRPILLENASVDTTNVVFDLLEGGQVKGLGGDS